MKKIDLFVQSVLMLAGAGIVLSTLFLWDAETLFFLLYLQLFIGPYQLLSAVVRLMAQEYEKQFQGYLKAYLSLSLFYLSSIGVMNVSGMSTDTQLSYIVLYMVVPWSLATYYFTHCWKRYLSEKKSRRSPGSFLPHIGF